MTNNVTNETKKSSEELKEKLRTASKGVDYLPPGAKLLAESDKQMWGIEGEDFTIYYETSENLLNAFVQELMIKHTATRSANYRKHLEYIWTIIDPKFTIFPKNAFTNSQLIEDQYHNVTPNLVGKGGNEASTLRVRYVAVRFFIRFLRRRHVIAGLNRNDLNQLLQNVEDWNSDFTNLTAQRKTDLRKIKIKRADETKTHDSVWKIYLSKEWKNKKSNVFKIS